jgi:hypothetical protein
VQAWQIAITLLVAILVGILVGILLSYILLKLVYHNNLDLMTVCRIFFGKQSWLITPGGLVPKPWRQAPGPPGTEKQVEAPVSTNNNGGTLSDLQIPGREDILKLFIECEQNREKIRGFSGNNLIPLQTQAWDSNRNFISSLNPTLRDDLECVYTDIALLNNLVWLSTEFHRSGPGIQAQYMVLNENIAKRLDTIIEATPAYVVVEK